MEQIHLYKLDCRAGAHSPSQPRHRRITRETSQMVEMFRLSFIYIFSGRRENSNDFRFVDFKSHTELLQNILQSILISSQQKLWIGRYFVNIKSFTETKHRSMIKMSESVCQCLCVLQQLGWCVPRQSRGGNAPPGYNRKGTEFMLQAVAVCGVERLLAVTLKTVTFTLPGPGLRPTAGESCCSASVDCLLPCFIQCLPLVLTELLESVSK